MSTLSLRRRLGALVLIPAILALSACGMKYDITVDEAETVDVTAITWGDVITEDQCTNNPLISGDNEYEMTSTFKEYDGQPACESVATGVPLSAFSPGNGGSTTIRHEGDLFIADIEVGDVADQVNSYEQLSGEDYSGFQASLTLTFPGKVTEATGNAPDVSGNSVTWNLMDQNGTLHAEGKDTPGLPLVWMLVVFAVLLAIVGGVAAVVLISRKKKAAAAAPAFPAQAVPGPAPQGYTPGQYGQPGQPSQPGYGQPSPQQPGQPPQSYSPGQYGQPGQPGYGQQNPQQPGNPDGLY